jgi:aspartate/methionine/tyrosine aminotransferase
LSKADPLQFFELLPIRAAKVSEISEATAMSPVPPEERVNFHIGNPVQDKRLSSAYLRLALGVDITNEELTIEDIDKFVDHLGLLNEDKAKVHFLAELIKKAAPYSPRGGFLKSKPHPVVRRFNEWLSKSQQEPLSYDTGEKTGKREIILASGGTFETLRVLFHSLSDFMAMRPITIFIHGIRLPPFLKNFKEITFLDLDESEPVMLSQLTEYYRSHEPSPTFLLMGRIVSEESRRQLRQMSLSNPLMFLEVNDAPNHLSLAREAKMMNRVIRLLTPGVLNQRLKKLSIVFVIGNSDFLQVIETVHFQLKGTPSSTEIEFLDYLLNLPLNDKQADVKIDVKAEYESTSQFPELNYVGDIVSHVENKLETIVKSGSLIVDRAVGHLEDRVHLPPVFQRFKHINSDKFANIDATKLVDDLVMNVDDKDWMEELSQSYLGAFLKHHPEYKPDSTLVASGSSRTVLSLLGFHCGIREVVIPDLSWTYEHCFPKSYPVSLTEDFQLDVEAIINTVQARLNSDKNWWKYGAVVLNNPHNATGQIFRHHDITKLITWLLHRRILVIDDLAYQNVKPSEDLEQIPTIRQIADDLTNLGYITEEESEYVITVHAMSKTDSYAGARLSVVEIRHRELFEKFQSIISFLKPNIAAIALAYLFYRNRVESVNAYYRLRNRIFKSRSDALLDAVRQLPRERNQFNIRIDPPVGSMYPKMIIDNLPAGLSLVWLASGLARQGIGLIPLSTFARTERGYDTGRKSFRLTLGGTDGKEALAKKTRRVLIDLNRMIAEEAANYNRRHFKYKEIHLRRQIRIIDEVSRWKQMESAIHQQTDAIFTEFVKRFNMIEDYELHKKRFESEFLPFRLSIFKTRFEERQVIANELANLYLSNNSVTKEFLEKEFYKDDLARRKEAFLKRLFDRTVHPTQMYSLETELLFERLIYSIFRRMEIDERFIKSLSTELIKEYFGSNVPIMSSQEPEELLLDLNSMIAVENYLKLHSDHPYETFLSFWGDWDGSNRPSGQGHSLVGAVLIENVVRQATIIQALMKSNGGVKIDEHLLSEIEKLPESNRKFSALLSRITRLTHQLEKRYRGTLPVNVRPGKLRSLGMKLHLAKDPLTSLWQHNDRLEREMLDLRKRRRDTLEYYFSLNKQLRKTLHSLIPQLVENLSNTELLLELSLYRDLLKRFVVTPRIHQKLITTQDQFAIDTTVHNINEINELSGKYGNPGLVLALQVSMTTKPEALISLDRKLRSKREEILREKTESELPNVWIIPLFEDIEAVKGISEYLNKVWDYAFQSRRMDQETSDRFSEIIAEIFVAGSDLSQQVGQAMGMNLYLESKYELLTWLSSHGLIGRVRIKLGSGEPMQRQGGYYSPVSGKPLFLENGDNDSRLSRYLEQSTRRSTFYATTPLMGVFATGDLRTFQSNLFEKCRQLSVKEMAQLVYHLQKAQEFYETETFRASEPLSDTRLQFSTRGLQELERLTIGKRDKTFDEFLGIHRDNFRQILYGREEDVIGIHVISYFIGRATPPFRDRPTARPGQEMEHGADQEIIQRIAGTIPLSKYGSLLRAISHNQAQTVVLGINQLTTGLFRALDNFSRMEFAEGEAAALISDQILPRLPVYEMIHTLRVYHDPDLTYVDKLEKAFPPGNSALIALREDTDLMRKYLPLFQKELLRRHGLDVSEFFSGDAFIPQLLPTVRPDVAVLLQHDIFNTDVDNLLSQIGGKVSEKWVEEVNRLLKIPTEVRYWRSKIWKLLEEPVFQRVTSFCELAIALHSLSSSAIQKEYLFSPKRIKLAPQLATPSFDDSMQEFLSAALEYLTTISESMVEVPVNIIRALREVETIIKIEEQALDPKQQDLLRFYLVQIARLTGENG